MLKWKGIGRISGCHIDGPQSSVSTMQIFQSHPHAERMRDQHLHEYIIESLMKPNTSYLIRIEFVLPVQRNISLESAKFKLISLSSC